MELSGEKIAVDLWKSRIKVDGELIRGGGSWIEEGSSPNEDVLESAVDRGIHKYLLVKFP